MIYHKSATHRDFTGFEALSKQVLSETFQKNQSAPQNGLEALCLCGFPEPGFQNLLPARGRKLSNFNILFLLLLCFKIFSPQGDGNFLVFRPVGFVNQVSKSSPRKGTETLPPVCREDFLNTVSKSSPRKGTETKASLEASRKAVLVSKSSPRKGTETHLLFLWIIVKQIVSKSSPRKGP